MNINIEEPAEARRPHDKTFTKKPERITRSQLGERKTADAC